MSVSVVIPTHNRAGTLGLAIVSAAMQNPVEVLVIDDASTDDTVGIVEQLRGIYPCIRYVRHAAKADDWQDVIRPTADKRRQRLWWWMRGASWARGDGGGRREVMIWWRWPAEA